MRKYLGIVHVAYSPQPYYGQPTMYAPQPRNPAVVPAIVTIIAAVMVLLGLVLPVAGISVMGFTMGINLWGVSFMGFSMNWWSVPMMPAAQLGLLTASVIMAILGMVFGFVAGGLMFIRKNVGRVLAVLTGIFAILAVVFFWTGLLMDSVGSGSVASLFSIGLFPHAGTFTLIIGAVMAFVGAGMFHPSEDMPMMAPPPMTPYPAYEVAPQYGYETPPSQTPTENPGWPPPQY